MPSLLEYHIGRLTDKNPRVRADSARELGLLGDPAALEALEARYREETDPNVKAMIQFAGRLLYKRKKLQERGDAGDNV